MADQVYTVALDDKGFASGLSRIEKQNKLTADRIDAAWQRQGKSMEGKWGASLGAASKAIGKFAGISAGAFATAQRAIHAYAEEFPGAAAGAEHLDAAMKGLLIGLGRDLEGSGVSEWLAGLVEGLESARHSAVNAIVDFFEFGKAAQLDAIAKGNEQLAERRKLMEELIDLQIGQAEAEGRTGDAADLRAQKQARADAKRLAELEGKVGSDSPELAKARAALAGTAAGKAALRRTGLDQQTSDEEASLRADIAEASGDTLGAKNIRENLRHRKQVRAIDQLEAQGADVTGLRASATEANRANLVRIAGEEESPAARAFKAARAQDVDRAGQSAALQQAAEIRRIEQLALEGHEKEAALAKVRLEFSRQRAEIEKADLVTQEEKQRLLDELGVQEATALTVTGEGFERKKKAPGDVRTLEAGFGANASQVFGGGGSGRKTDQDQLREAREQTRVLKNIERNTKVGNGYAE